MKLDIKKGQQLVGLIGGIVTLVVPAVKAVNDKIKGLIAIPMLYSKDVSIKLEQAADILQKSGLSVAPIEIREADTKYKNLF
ncbi:MAG: hypothetical protein LBC19_09135 [Tannerella sp.]|nr:hypothetical protein [Tannerella sp.]